MLGEDVQSGVGALHPFFATHYTSADGSRADIVEAAESDRSSATSPVVNYRPTRLGQAPLNSKRNLMILEGFMTLSLR
jgi:hypothetical protein